MRNILSHTALATLLGAMLAGCSQVYYDWDRRSFGHPPAQVHEAPAPVAAKPPEKTPPRAQTASVRPHKRKKPKPPPDMKEMSIQPEPEVTEAPPPLPPTSAISMAAPVDTSTNAERAIDVTSQRLARYDRARLAGSSLAAYDEASGLLTQGKQALADKDYVAASGFAQKASVLADRLQATAK